MIFKKIKIYFIQNFSTKNNLLCIKLKGGKRKKVKRNKFIYLFVGLGPYNFVGVSAGNMLSSLNSIDEIFTWKTFLSIIVIAAAAIGPAYIINRRYTMKKNSISKKIM